MGQELCTKMCEGKLFMRVGGARVMNEGGWDNNYI